MNKRPFSKLGLLLLFLSLVSCGQKNNSSGEDGIKTKVPSVENSVESKQEDEDIQKNTEQNTQQDATENELFSVVGYNTVQGFCEYYLAGLNVTPRIEPSIITGTYSDYNVKTEGNIYIDVILDVKNLKNEDKMADDLITTKIKINNNEYTCFSVVESADGSDLESYASIKALESRKIHYVAEVPITEATGEIEIILTVNGKDFSNKFDLEGMMS